MDFAQPNSAGDSEGLPLRKLLAICIFGALAESLRQTELETESGKRIE